MVTSAVFITLIGTVLLKCAISAAINYEPIKITVNENFNSQPAQDFQEPKSIEPGIIHQGANFYFKPQLNLPPSYIPPRIEELISLIQQYHHSCTKDTSELDEKNKLMETLKPFMYRSSDIPEEVPMGIVLKNGNNLQNTKTSDIIASELKENSTKSVAMPIKIIEEQKPVTPELLVMPEAPVLRPLSHNGIPVDLKEVKEEESVILKEPTDVFPTIAKTSKRLNSEPILNYVEPKPVISELEIIPETRFSFNDIHEMKGENPILEPVIIEEESKPVTPQLGVIPEAHVLPLLSSNDILVVEQEPQGENPILEPVMFEVESKPELAVIPEAPVLPPLSLSSIPSIVEEDAKKEESIILEEPTTVFPIISEITARPIQEPIINYVQSKPVTPELGAIPEAPILPPLSLSETPSVIEDVKKEESILLEEPTSVFLTISEISTSPIQEPIINYVEPKPVTHELGAIPKAPVLSPLPLNNIPFTVEDVKEERPIILKEPTNVFPTDSEISARPIQEPINSYVEPNPVTPEVGSIQEAPVLPPLSLSNITSIVEEDVKKEESIVLESPTSVFPTISEISARPKQEPIINDIEPKPVTLELGAIPEAPVLPPLSLSSIPSIVEEVAKKEESIILKEPTSGFSTISEMSARPIQEPIINYVQSKPATPELGTIPEAPILPPLSISNNPSVDENDKKEESIILEEPTSVFPIISEITARPIQEPVINYVEPKPVTPELETIPDAPVLSPPSLSNISSVVGEDVEKDESKVSEEPTNAFSKIPEISVSPMQEPIINYVESEPVTPEIGAIPEAPVLPSPSLNNIASILDEDVKQQESIILEEPTNVLSTIPEISVSPMQKPIFNYVELKPVISELGVFPEDPVLPHFSLNDIHVNKNEVNIEEPITLEDYSDVFPKIPEITIRPLTESSMFKIGSKPATSGLVVISKAPVKPPQPYIGIPPIFEKGKIEESFRDKESTGIYSTIPKISAILKPSVLSKTADSFPVENKVFPKEGKIEVFLGESVEEFSPNTEISSGMTFQEPEITNSYMLEEISRPNPFTESVVTIRETLPSNNLGVFSYVPIASHFSNRAPYSKQLMNPKPASLQNFLVMKHPFHPEMPYSKLSPSITEYNKHFILPSYYAHDIVEKRITPNMAFKNNAPKRAKNVIRPNDLRGPSQL